MSAGRGRASSGGAEDDNAASSRRNCFGAPIGGDASCSRENTPEEEGPDSRAEVATGARSRGEAGTPLPLLLLTDLCDGESGGATLPPAALNGIGEPREEEDAADCVGVAAAAAAAAGSNDLRDDIRCSMPENRPPPRFPCSAALPLLALLLPGGEPPAPPATFAPALAKYASPPTAALSEAAAACAPLVREISARMHDNMDANTAGVGPSPELL